jgi:hypothetical protein
MEAEKKLRGAIYHFQRMEKAYLKNEENFIYELEAFLVKVRSVPDVLLEDFNEKLSLGISLEEELYPKTFEERARQLQNTQAISFIQWWKSKMEQIRSDKLGSILFGKRNISVHRKVVRPDLKKITLYETIRATTEYINIRKYDEKGNLIEDEKSLGIPPAPEEPKPPEVEWCFSEYPDENVLEVSRKILQTVKRFVEEAKSRFN